MAFYKWERLVSAARKASSARGFVIESVNAADEYRVREWLIELLMQEVRKADRAEVRVIEHAASTYQPPEPPSEAYLASALGMTIEEYRVWKVERKEQEEITRQEGEELRRQRAREADERIARSYAKVGEILADWKAEMRIEWTQELLDAEIALPDGTRVTWGEATRDQLSVRAAMFQKNVVSNLEGGAFVLAAIDRLDQYGATCLNETVSQAA